MHDYVIIINFEMILYVAPIDSEKAHYLSTAHTII